MILGSIAQGGAALERGGPSALSALAARRVRNVTENVHFDRLGVTVTRPTFWDIAPAPLAIGLEAFMRFLLSGSGLCVLGESSGTQTDWLVTAEGKPDTAAALRWLEETRDLHLQLANLFGQVRAGEMFQHYIQRRCWLFFDHECLLSALARALDSRGWEDEPIRPYPDRLRAILNAQSAAPEELLESIQNYLDAGLRLYMSLSLDFAGLKGDDLIYSPQFVCWNYWPEERRFAPPPPEGLPPLPRLGPEQASMLLEDFMWRQVETTFVALRQEFGIGHALPEVAQMRHQPPVFYFLSPVEEEIPDSPAVYFEDDWFPVVQRMVRTHLGTDDPLSHDVAGALLEGELLVLRREFIARQRETSTRYYLILPCNAQPYYEWDEFERELLFIADKLSFLEFSIAHEARDLITDLLPWSWKLALWSGSVDDAAEIVTELVQEVAIGPPQRRRRAFRQIEMLQQRLLHMSNDLMRKTDDVLSLPRRLNVYMDGTADFSRQVFTSRDLGFITSITEALADAYPYTYLKVPIDSAAQQAQLLRETFAQVTGNIQSILEQERRAAEERQAQLTSLLNFVVFLMTIATVLPALVKVQLPETIPYHNELEVLASWVSVGVVVVAIGGLLATQLGRGVTWISDRVRPPFVRYLGEKITRLWQIADLADVRARQLTAGSRDGDSSEEEAAALRGEIEQLDVEACNLLIELWGELTERDEKQQSREELSRDLLSRRLRRLQRRIERFLLISMLFDDRPDRLILPRALCVFCYKSTDFLVSSVVHDYEFEFTFKAAGYDSLELQAVREWCQKHARELGIEAFVSRLDEMGVGAGRLGTPPEES